MSKARTWQSNIAGPQISSADCRYWPQKWCNDRIVIVAGGSPASALAAKSATTTIPIVFMNTADPVSIGLVASFNRPGGNITGATLLSAELAPKRLGIVRDLLPAVTKIAVLVNPTRPRVDAQKTQVQEVIKPPASTKLRSSYMVGIL